MRERSPVKSEAWGRCAPVKSLVGGCAPVKSLRGSVRGGRVIACNNAY